MRGLLLLSLLAVGCASLPQKPGRSCVAVLFDTGLVAWGELTGREVTDRTSVLRYEVDFGRGLVQFIRADAMEVWDQPCRR
jgi:hypothetical protein